MAGIRRLYEIRMAKYQELLSEYAARPEERTLAHHGRLRRFATSAGVSERYLSHINNGRKNIGDQFARDLENGMGKAENWMDQETSSERKKAPPFFELAALAHKVDAVAAERALLAIVRKGLCQQGRNAG